MIFLKLFIKVDIYVGANMASSVEWYINWKTASEILFVAMNTVKEW